MTLTRFPAGHVPNARARRDLPYGPRQAAVVDRTGIAAARAEIAAWPGYRPTPLVALPGLAHRLGVDVVLYKDEDERLGLHSFKALGGAYAVLCVLREHLAARGAGNVTAGDLLAGHHRAIVSGLTVSCATDGNHGRSVAWGAQMFGCRCRIYLHAHVSVTREREIARYGAIIHRVSGGYDDSVRQCAEDAAARGWFLVADTAEDEDARVPAIVMRGYGVMADEILSQPGGGDATHLFVQGGVGGLAGAVCGCFWETMGDGRPRSVVVEPSRADCIARSIAAGRPTPVPGEVDTFMACLAAGEVSRPAWRILEYGVDDVLTLPDEAAREAMRVLAAGVDGDPPLVSGESGCAAIAGLVAAASDPALREALGLDGGSRVVAIGSEGATDPITFERVVGRPAHEVARAGVRSGEAGVRSGEAGVRSGEAGVRSGEAGGRSGEAGTRYPRGNR